MHDRPLLLGALGGLSQAVQRHRGRESAPLGVGILYDPFAGSGSTLAAAEALGYHAVGTDQDPEYDAMACQAFGPLAALKVGEP